MYKKILYATDLNSNHYEISKKAAAFAKKSKAELFLIHVIELPTSAQIAQGLGFAELANPGKSLAKQVMRELGEVLHVPEENQLIEIGSVPFHVLDAAQKLQVDLIIFGNHYPIGYMGYLGSNANGIIHNTSCDTLTLYSSEA